MKVFWWQNNNFGDIITPILLEHYLNAEIEHAGARETGKFLGVGSIVGTAMRENDTVWGSGILRDKVVQKPKGVEILALRGPLTEKRIKGATTDTYGDPGLLVSDIYNPEVEVKHELGVIPHFVEKNKYKDCGYHLIDIQGDWKEVIKEIKSCKMIASSSLHGIITAEAYGIPAIWLKQGDKVKGTDLKYQDYFLGTGRKKQSPIEGVFRALPIAPIENLEEIQNKLKEKLWT